MVDLDDIQDPLQQRDNQDANFSPFDKRHIGKEDRPLSSNRNSNMGKARRIVNKVKLHKRQSNPKSDETHHQSNLGSSSSTWLFR